MSPLRWLVILAVSLSIVSGIRGSLAAAVGYPCVSMRVDPVAPGLAVGTVARINRTACGNHASDDSIPIAVNDSCTLDSSINRVLAFSAASLSSGNVFCKATLASGGTVASEESQCQSAGRCSYRNVSLQLPYYRAETRSMWASLLSDSGSSADEVLSWFATIQFSAWNRSSTWMCVDSIFVARRTGADSVVTASLEAVQSLNFSSLANGTSCDTSCAIRRFMTPCVFGLGINRIGGGAGSKFSDLLVYTNGTLLQYAFNSSSTSSALPPVWSATWNQSNSDVTEETFLLNRTNAALSILSFEHRTAQDGDGDVVPLLLPAAFSQLSGTLMFLWTASITFCQRRISNVRQIAGGNLESVDVLVAVDFSLQDTLVILPLAIAKAIAVRSSVVDASKCALDCSDAASLPSTCYYRCLLLDAPSLTSNNQTSFAPSSLPPPSYTANATTSSTSARWTGSLANLRIRPFNGVSPSGSVATAFELNISSLVRVENGAASLELPTWSPAATSSDAAESATSTPLVLLGARAFAPYGFNVSSNASPVSSVDASLQTLGNGTMRLQMDRSGLQGIGIASEVLFSSTATTSAAPTAAKSLFPSSMCTIAPDCGPNEVLVDELNRCVSTTCSQFLFIKADSETGECWISFGVVSTTTILLLVAALGELLLTSVTMRTWAEMSKLAQQKRRDP